MYLEPDRPYVAKQLNGSIISAFIKSVYNFLHTNVEDTYNYFRNLGINTAESGHLFTIGKLMGLQLFSMFTDSGGGKYITFADESFDAEEYGYNNGWASEYEEYLEGYGMGVFGTGEEREYPIPLTAPQYRAILNALSQISSAAADSMLAIDTLARYVLDSTDYSISYNNGYIDVVNLVLGDSIQLRYTSAIQSMFDKLLDGGTVTVLVSHI